MNKLLVLVLLLGLVATGATASSGIGAFGSYMNGEDVDAGFGGGLKLKADVAEYFAIEARASCLTQFSDYLEDDDLFFIPIEGDILLNLPISDSLMTIYGGVGAGYYIIPEYESPAAMGDVDVDLQDGFGFFGLAGLEIAIGDTVSLFAEGKYLLFTVDEAKVDDQDVDLEGDAEVDFSGISINAGLLFRF